MLSSVPNSPLDAAHPAVPVLAVKTPLKAVEAVEGGEVTFSVDLTVASSGEWFLDGEALRASSIYVIRRDRTRHMLTIREVPARLHGAQLKFVANGIETSIQMVVRGRPESQNPHFYLFIFFCSVVMGRIVSREGLSGGHVIKGAWGCLSHAGS